MIINTTHYCWVIGNTGFRESALYEKIESYLLILEEFKNRGYVWSDNQRDFFELMKEFGFMEKGSTSEVNAPKAARLKTSPLEKLGLISVDREVTDVGDIILQRAKQRIKNPNISFDEEHFLENDGDVYIRQLLKLHFYANVEEKKGIRPFVLFLTFLKEFKYLSKNEMAYILPLIISEDLIAYGRNSILEYRKAKKDQNFDEYSWIKKYLINHKNMLSNIQRIKNYIEENIENIENDFENQDESKIREFIIEIDDNGKSKKYSLKLYDLFYAMYKLWKNIDDSTMSKRAIDEIIKGIEKTSNTQAKEWRRAVLGVTNKAVLRTLNEDKYQLYIEYFKKNFYSTSFEEFITNVFDHLWYIKILNNLSDYEDHNTRYLKLSNILETEYIDGEKVLKVSEFYQILINKVLEDSEIYEMKFDQEEYKAYLYKNTYKIPDFLEEDMNNIALNVIHQIRTISDEEIKDEKPEYLNYRQWINELKEKFIEKKVINMIERTRKDIEDNTPDNLINCLEYINKRRDNKLREVIDTEADIPTVFEYLVWKAFLVLGNYTKNPIKFANFSFDNDLKPVQHAGGGIADVIFNYEDHDLILEATLTNEENQRKLEMEPVPRHLAKYRFDVNNNSYCIFIAPNIDPNVAVVHRSFKKFPYYIKDKDDKQYKPVADLSIIPLSIDDLRLLINYSIKRDVLYKNLKEEVFDALIGSDEEDGYIWYSNKVYTTIRKLNI